MYKTEVVETVMKPGTNEGVVKYTSMCFSGFLSMKGDG
jgi:hypothetical protein